MGEHLPMQKTPAPSTIIGPVSTKNHICRWYLATRKRGRQWRAIAVLSSFLHRWQMDCRKRRNSTSFPCSITWRNWSDMVMWQWWRCTSCLPLRWYDSRFLGMWNWGRWNGYTCWTFGPEVSSLGWFVNISYLRDVPDSYFQTLLPQFVVASIPTPTFRFPPLALLYQGITTLPFIRIFGDTGPMILPIFLMIICFSLKKVRKVLMTENIIACICRR
jgi:hypothetical protein